jgi:3',5'-cyclic AMP phosphodiesterase CpdA
MKKSSKKFLSLLLSVTLLVLLAAVPSLTSYAASGSSKLRVAVLSDTHYYLPELAGGYNEAFQEDKIIGQPVEQAPGVLHSALAAIKARNKKEKIDFLLISGDLTNTAEYVSHVRFAEIISAFEKETGIPVAVAPGNHDIDYSSREFTTGVRRDAQRTCPADFLKIYAKLGYDLPGLTRFTTDLGAEGNLSYAADLGKHYRLVALDTHVRRISPELRAWAVDQCEKAVAAGKTVIGMGHHPLNEQFKGQLTIMQGEGIENMHEISEEFADAGMHFYFSGHLHMSGISPWVSDRGETLYDIITPGLWDFPGDYRVVDFSAEGRKITADVRSYVPDEVLPVTANGITYPQPYNKTSFWLTFGYESENLAGFLKANAKKALTGQLNDLRESGGLTAKVKESVDFLPLNALLRYLDAQLINRPEKIVALVNSLVDDAFALPVSKLPCTRFINELGFGDAKKRGTLEDAGNSLITYMFWKKHDPKDDPFMQDVLRRMKNGELVDQVLDFAVPKVLATLGAEILPLLANVDIALVNRAFQTALGALNLPLLFVLALLPGTRNTISATLYDVVSEIITSSSPTGSGNGRLVYDGPVVVLTNPNTFRLPYDVSVTIGGLGRNAEITWYTKADLVTSEVILTDRAGSPAQGIDIEYSTEFEDITVNQLDLAVAQMMGYTMRAAKHTAKISGLNPLKTYSFTAGDSEFDWRSVPQKLAPTDTPVKDFAGQARDWFQGEFKLPGIKWNNRGYHK